MPDREWFEVTGYDMPFTNLELAREHAAELAKTAGSDVDVMRCTRTTVVRYWREIRVQSQDVPPLA